MGIRSIDVASLERATLAAVPPQAKEEAAGWLLGFDAGTVGRARSAAPLAHVAAADAVVPQVEARYRARGLPTLWRIPHLPCFAPLQARLAQSGYAAAKPTLVQTGTVEAMARLAHGNWPVQLERSPSEGWAAVFLGEGFDPVDGASRLDILRRAHESVFANISVEGHVAAVGSACFSHGWCGIHGMRTAPAFRGRGLAASILAMLAREATQRGIRRTFLQVEQSNEAAQSLYRRAGLATVWPYAYWSGPL
jgi:GNAT superfamily N-acetyltransferase